MVGHVTPGLPIARALVAQGHEVAWYTGRRFRAKIEATGARYLPMKRAVDYSEGDVDDAYPERRTLQGLPKLRYDMKHIFADPIPAQMEDFREILREFPADALLADTGFVGAGRLHEKGEAPPWAIFGITALGIVSGDTAPFGLGLPPDQSAPGRLRNRLLYRLCDDVLFRDVNIHYGKIRTDIGLPPIAGNLFDSQRSPYLLLQTTVAEFEYPRRDLPPQVHYVGAFAPDRPAEVREKPSWWADLDAGKPVVMVTQGTVANDLRELVRPTLDALTGEDVVVVVTTAGGKLEGPIPANARVAAFLPYDDLLPKVDLLVTNGGYGTVQMALAKGVPIVGCGHTEDKPEICQRIEWSGAGLRVRARKPSPEAIRTAVRRVLSDSRFRARAASLQAAYARHDPAAESACLLEQLAATGRPVYRNASDSVELATAPRPKL